MPVKMPKAEPSGEKIVWPPLPRVSRKDAMAIEEYLTRKYNSKRPPEVAAKVLGLIIELWDRGEPFPQRAHIAADLNCTKWGRTLWSTSLSPAS